MSFNWTLVIQYIINEYNQRVAVNNRSLTAFRRDGMEPTNIIDVSNDQNIMNEVLDRLSEMEGGLPSLTIRIRGNPDVPDASAIY